jgi:hypothetical protein
VAETLLTGVSIYEHCDRNERPRCCFEVATPDTAEQKQWKLVPSIRMYALLNENVTPL